MVCADLKVELHVRASLEGMGRVQRSTVCVTKSDIARIVPLRHVPVWLGYTISTTRCRFQDTATLHDAVDSGLNESARGSRHNVWR